MSDPGEPGVPGPTVQAEDAWWDAVYDDPAEREVAQRPTSGTVDDWFATALGAMGEPAPSATPPAPRAPAETADPPVPAVPPPPTVPPAPRVPDPRVSAAGAERAEPDLDLDLDPDVLAWTPGIPASRRQDRVPLERPEPDDSSASTHPIEWPRSPMVPEARSPEREPTAPPAREASAAERDGGATDPSGAPAAGEEFGAERGAPLLPPPPRSVPEDAGEPDEPEEPDESEDEDNGAPTLRLFRTDPVEAPPEPAQAPAPPAADPRVAGQSSATAGAAGRTGGPPPVPTPTVPDGAALRWGRSRPPTGGPLPEPDALPEADPDDLGALVPDTVLELARHGTMTLRAGSTRGEASRALGAPREDRLVVARFGDGADGLVVVVVTSGRGAEEAAAMLAAAVGRSRAGLLVDLRHGAQERLRFGLQRLTARAARVLGEEGALHAVLAPLDPTNRLRAGFGTGPGALMLLGDDSWYDAYAGRRLTVEAEPGPEAAQQGRFRFRAVVPEPGDVLLVCTQGLAAPLRSEPAVAALLAEHWSQLHAPTGVDFLRQIQARASGHSGDRTAAAIWAD